MPISELLPVEFSAIQFADKHAAALLSPDVPDGDRFADYIASIMNTEVVQTHYAHEPTTDQESAAASPISPVNQSESSPRIADRKRSDSLSDGAASLESDRIERDDAPAEKQAKDVIAKQADDRNMRSGEAARRTTRSVDSESIKGKRSSAEEGDRPSLAEHGNGNPVLSTIKRSSLHHSDPSGQSVADKAGRPGPRSEGGIAERPIAQHQIIDLRSNDPRTTPFRGAGPGAVVHQATPRGVGQRVKEDRDATRGAAERLAPSTRASKGRKSRLAANRAIQSRGAQPGHELRQQTQRLIEGQGAQTVPSVVDSLNEAGGTVGHSGRSSNVQVLAVRASGDTPGGIGQALGQNLQETINSQIVRSSRMIVRDNANGEIRLHLKPEHLGDVRFFIELHEGRIAGRIIVENSTIRDVFEDNIPELVKAFTAGGFESAMLDVTVSDSGNRREESVAVAPHKVKELERAVPEIQMFEDDHVLVDMVV